MMINQYMKACPNQLKPNKVFHSLVWLDFNVF